MTGQRTERANLDDVAARAGVSRTTVSRFFNEPDKIKPATRRKIDSAIRAMDYVPNAAARALASRRSRLIGAIIPTLDNALFSRELKDTESRLLQSGYSLIVGSFDYRYEREYEMLQSMLSRNVDGIILVGIERDPHLYRLLDRQGVPYVTTWTIDPASPHPQIGTDTAGAARELVTMLAGLGHTEFGMIDLPLDGNDRAAARHAGVRAGIEAHGAHLPEQAVIRAPVEFSEGKAAFARLMALTPRPTAVVCGGDIFAIGALLAAPGIGVDVPRDVSITGFDNHPLAALLQPSLTTVSLPVRDTGLKAAESLLAMIEGRPVERISVFPYRIECRESTGRPVVDGSPGITP